MFGPDRPDIDEPDSTLDRDIAIIIFSTPVCVFVFIILLAYIFKYVLKL